MNCSLPGSSVHGILQAGILEWIAIPLRHGIFCTWDQTRDSCIAGSLYRLSQGSGVLIWDLVFIITIIWFSTGFQVAKHQFIFHIYVFMCEICFSFSELLHSDRLWCWEGLGAGGEGENRGWDGWMASLTRWTWVWVNSGSWRWTGRPGMLQFMGSQRVGHNWATELNWTEQALSSSASLELTQMHSFL